MQRGVIRCRLTIQILDYTFESGHHRDELGSESARIQSPYLAHVPETTSTRRILTHLLLTQIMIRLRCFCHLYTNRALTLQIAQSSPYFGSSRFGNVPFARSTVSERHLLPHFETLAYTAPSTSLIPVYDKGNCPPGY